MSTPALDYAKEHREEFREELQDFLRIPSISTDPAYADDVRQAAHWLIAHLSSIGLKTELLEAEDRHPLVYAEHKAANEDAKTVLIYGHYDVQPALKSDGWESEPFEPVARDGKIYARGATDDKGQTFAHIKAVESLLKSEKNLPVNVKFIIEGEEEAGSQFIAQFVQEHPERLAADVCVISDSSMADIEQPVILNALRGTALFTLTVHGPKQDLHSGMFGGTVHNPLQALAEIIAQLHDADGKVAVPGFYDAVRKLTEAEREAIAQIPWDNVTWAEETGAPLPWGESDYTLRERVGARPTLEITGIAGGYYGEGFKSIVPQKALAKISCRLVADQKPDDIAEKFRKFIAKIAAPTVEVDVQYMGGAPASHVNIESPMMQAAISAYEKGWGQTPLFKREGGSIPIVGDLQTRLKLPVILMGFGLGSDNLHGPNEHFSIEMFHKGIDTAIWFLKEVAAL